MGVVDRHSNMTTPFYAAIPIFEGAFLMKRNGDKTREQLIDELEASEAERRKAEKRLERLHLVLRTIGNVNTSSLTKRRTRVEYLKVPVRTLPRIETITMPGSICWTNPGSLTFPSNQM